MPEPGELTGEGSEILEGSGYLTWDHPPRITPKLSDLWFYGASNERPMIGEGSLGIAGEGELS